MFTSKLIKESGKLVYLDDKSKLNIDEEEITRRRKKGEPEILDVERCWLTGIFHKNDGYLTPVVLNPFRREGRLDIRKETLSQPASVPQSVHLG